MNVYERDVAAEVEATRQRDLDRWWQQAAANAGGSQ
jgi:hypothetical protein